jgi:hypothetical protein
VGKEAGGKNLEAKIQKLGGDFIVSMDWMREVDLLLLSEYLMKESW